MLPAGFIAVAAQVKKNRPGLQWFSSFCHRLREGALLLDYSVGLMAATAGQSFIRLLPL